MICTRNQTTPCCFIRHKSIFAWLSEKKLKPTQTSTKGMLESDQRAIPNNATQDFTKLSLKM